MKKGSVDENGHAGIYMISVICLSQTSRVETLF